MLDLNNSTVVLVEWCYVTGDTEFS